MLSEGTKAVTSDFRQVKAAAFMFHNSVFMNRMTIKFGVQPFERVS